VSRADPCYCCLVPSVLSALNDRIDLEKRFVLALFAMLALACVVYGVIEARASSLFATIALITAVGLIGSAIAHYVLFNPIRRLVVMAKAVGSGDFSKRLALRRHDEIGTLALEMDAMCDQLEAAQLASEAHIAALEQLRHADRIATLGRLASSVAHELGNPLNVIELRAQLIATGAAATLHQAQQNAVAIVEQTQRMTTIIDEILSFARRHPAKIARLNLVAVLHKAVGLCEHTSKKSKARILVDFPDTAVELDGDADKLLQIIVNLIINGIQAMPGGGTLCVSLNSIQRSAVDDPDGLPRTYLCIAVVDEGVGIPEHLTSKVFEPFFSTRSTDGGTGLGLSIAQGIAHEHEGWISVTSEVGRGSSFLVFLPKQRPTVGGAHAA
jgi:two-component system, NtrC family, sensor kinase